MGRWQYWCSCSKVWFTGDGQWTSGTAEKQGQIWGIPQMVLLSSCWVIFKGCQSLTRNIKCSFVLVKIWSLWFLRFCLYQLFEVFTVVADWATCFHKSNQSWGCIGKSPYSYQHCKSTVLGKNLVYRENMTKYRCSWRHHDHHDTTISVHPYPQSNSSLKT